MTYSAAAVSDPQLNGDTSGVITLDGLSVSFGGRPILKDLRGELRGRAIGLLGPNGAGKTTLIHTLLGFHPPTSGTARIFGRDIRSEANQIKSLIGYMPERDSFIAKMSCIHFVRFMAELSGLPAAGRDGARHARTRPDADGHAAPLHRSAVADRARRLGDRVGRAAVRGVRA